MRIHIWIRLKDLEDLVYFLSDDFQWDREMKIDVWYCQPASMSSTDYIEISITPEQFKRLEDL